MIGRHKKLRITEQHRQEHAALCAHISSCTEDHVDFSQHSLGSVPLDQGMCDAFVEAFQNAPSIHTTENLPTKSATQTPKLWQAAYARARSVVFASRLKMWLTELSQSVEFPRPSKALEMAPLPDAAAESVWQTFSQHYASLDSVSIPTLRRQHPFSPLYRSMNFVLLRQAIVKKIQAAEPSSDGRPVMLDLTPQQWQALYIDTPTAPCYLLPEAHAQASLEQTLRGSDILFEWSCDDAKALKPEKRPGAFEHIAALERITIEKVLASAEEDSVTVKFLRKGQVCLTAGDRVYMFYAQISTEAILNALFTCLNQHLNTVQALDYEACSEKVIWPGPNKGTVLKEQCVEWEQTRARQKLLQNTGSFSVSIQASGVRFQVTSESTQKNIVFPALGLKGAQAVLFSVLEPVKNRLTALTWHDDYFTVPHRSTRPQYKGIFEKLRLQTLFNAHRRLVCRLSEAGECFLGPEDSGAFYDFASLTSLTKKETDSFLEKSLYAFSLSGGTCLLHIPEAGLSSKSSMSALRTRLHDSPLCLKDWEKDTQVEKVNNQQYRLVRMTKKEANAFSKLKEKDQYAYLENRQVQAVALQESAEGDCCPALNREYFLESLKQNNPVQATFCMPPEHGGWTREESARFLEALWSDPNLSMLSFHVFAPPKRESSTLQMTLETDEISEETVLDALIAQGEERVRSESLLERKTTVPETGPLATLAKKIEAWLALKTIFTKKPFIVPQADTVARLGQALQQLKDASISLDFLKEKLKTISDPTKKEWLAAGYALVYAEGVPISRHWAEVTRDLEIAALFRREWTLQGPDALKALKEAALSLPQKIVLKTDFADCDENALQSVVQVFDETALQTLSFEGGVVLLRGDSRPLLLKNASLHTQEQVSALNGVFFDAKTCRFSQPVFDTELDVEYLHNAQTVCIHSEESIQHHWNHDSWAKIRALCPAGSDSGTTIQTSQQSSGPQFVWKRTGHGATLTVKRVSLNTTQAGELLEAFDDMTYVTLSFDKTCSFLFSKNAQTEAPEIFSDKRIHWPETLPCILEGRSNDEAAYHLLRSTAEAYLHHHQVSALTLQWGDNAGIHVFVRRADAGNLRSDILSFPKGFVGVQDNEPSSMGRTLSAAGDNMARVASAVASGAAAVVSSWMRRASGAMSISSPSNTLMPLPDAIPVEDCYASWDENHCVQTFLQCQEGAFPELKLERDLWPLLQGASQFLRNRINPREKIDFATRVLQRLQEVTTIPNSITDDLLAKNCAATVFYVSQLLADDVGDKTTEAQQKTAISLLVLWVPILLKRPSLLKQKWVMEGAFKDKTLAHAYFHTLIDKSVFLSVSHWLHLMPYFLTRHTFQFGPQYALQFLTAFLSRRWRHINLPSLIKRAPEFDTTGDALIGEDGRVQNILSTYWEQPLRQLGGVLVTKARSREKNPPQNEKDLEKLAGELGVFVKLSRALYAFYKSQNAEDPAPPLPYYQLQSKLLDLRFLLLSQFGQYLERKKTLLTATNRYTDLNKWCETLSQLTDDDLALFEDYVVETLRNETFTSQGEPRKALKRFKRLGEILVHCKATKKLKKCFIELQVQHPEQWTAAAIHHAKTLANHVGLSEDELQTLRWKLLLARFIYIQGHREELSQKGAEWVRARISAQPLKNMTDEMKEYALKLLRDDSSTTLSLKDCLWRIKQQALWAAPNDSLNETHVLRWIRCHLDWIKARFQNDNHPALKSLWSNHDGSLSKAISRHSTLEDVHQHLHDFMNQHGDWSDPINFFTARAQMNRNLDTLQRHTCRMMRAFHPEKNTGCTRSLWRQFLDLISDLLNAIDAWFEEKKAYKPKAVEADENAIDNGRDSFQTNAVVSAYREKHASIAAKYGRERGGVSEFFAETAGITDDGSNEINLDDFDPSKLNRVIPAPAPTR